MQTESVDVNIYIIVFKGTTFWTKDFVASKMPNVAEKCSGLNHLRLSSQQTFLYVGKS